LANIDRITHPGRPRQALAAGTANASTIKPRAHPTIFHPMV
jgi:hypothetical protein